MKAQTSPVVVRSVPGKSPMVPIFVSVLLGMLAAPVHAQIPGLFKFQLGPRRPGSPSSQGTLPLRPEAARPLVATAKDIISAQCPPQAVGLNPAVSCGYLPVPLDRRHKHGQQINIYFEVYPHSNPGPAESALVIGNGGPGASNTANRAGFLFGFAPDLDVHDLLLIDPRGRGLSGAIDCEELQHGTALLDQAEGDCAAQLGDAASRYGDGDVAEDTDAVRAALGYDKLDYFGISYGGAEITAYATRFGEHLRSIVLDSPYGPPDLNQFVFEHHRTGSDPRMVRLDCLRSPTCAADHPDPDAALDELIQAIRLSPVEGAAHDANGNLLNVRIDEDALLNYLVGNFPTGNFTGTGEILAAATSLKRDDTAPLLRLGAEGLFSVFLPPGVDFGDPTVFSIGANRATACVDADEAWEWGAPVSEREKQYSNAVSDLPSEYFVPFSKGPATGLLFGFYGRNCLWWQKPTPSPPVTPHHATYPDAPTLVLGGDLDNIVPLEGTTKLAALFPNSTFVKVAEAGHGTVGWSQCAVNLVHQFIEILSLGDTSCAHTPAIVWPAVGRFPLLANDARPADVIPNSVNQIGLAERRVVTVAVAAATDAMQRSIIGSGNGVGLRAGTFHTDYGATAWTTTLNDCAFAEDVTVNGTVTWGFFSFVADLTVSGAGTAGGTLHVDGTWQAPGPVGNFTITGMLGSQQVAVLVPEA